NSSYQTDSSAMGSDSSNNGKSCSPASSCMDLACSAAPNCFNFSGKPCVASSTSTLSKALQALILSVFELTTTGSTFSQSASAAMYAKLLPLPLTSTAHCA